MLHVNVNVNVNVNVRRAERAMMSAGTRDVQGCDALSGPPKSWPKFWNGRRIFESTFTHLQSTRDHTLSPPCRPPS
jgi:hypothetical protein